MHNFNASGWKISEKMKLKSEDIFNEYKGLNQEELVLEFFTFFYATFVKDEWKEGTDWEYIEWIKQEMCDEIHAIMEYARDFSFVDTLAHKSLSGTTCNPVEEAKNPQNSNHTNEPKSNDGAANMSGGHFEDAELNEQATDGSSMKLAPMSKVIRAPTFYDGAANKSGGQMFEDAELNKQATDGSSMKRVPMSKVLPNVPLSEEEVLNKIKLMNTDDDDVVTDGRGLKKWRGKGRFREIEQWCIDNHLEEDVVPVNGDIWTKRTNYSTYYEGLGQDYDGVRTCIDEKLADFDALFLKIDEADRIRMKDGEMDNAVQLVEDLLLV